MAKTKYSIWMSYKKATDEADDLDDVASKIDKQKQKLTECRMGLSSVWKGVNSNNYQNKMIDKERELESLARNVREVAAAIRDIAWNHYEADKKALELAAKKRK